MPGSTALAEEVAKSLHKLMAVKDEYEVARLYTEGSFGRQLAETFESYERLEFHMAPPVLARRDKRTGHLKKMRFGPWMMTAFRALARLRALRGTALDVFGYMPERKWERTLLADYEAALDMIEANLAPETHGVTVALAAYPQKIRGFGHVKERHLKAARQKEAALLAEFAAPAPVSTPASASPVVA